jgi:uncharacterized membrane protein HdeD (DUF308 family)
MVVLTPTESEFQQPGWAAWLVMFLGALCAVAGIIVLAKPADSLETLAVIVGVFMLVDGIIEIALSLSRHTEGRGLVALVGVLNAVIGVLLIRHPIGGVAAVALLIGIWLVAIGVVRFISAFGSGHVFWNLVIAVAEVVAGVVIMVDPVIGYATLALLVGLGFIVRGVLFFVLGWALHAAGAPDTGAPAPTAGAHA